MLNYIWLSLVVVGVGIAVWSDARDISSDKYHNGRNVSAILRFSSSPDNSAKVGGARPCTILVSPADLLSAYGEPAGDTVRQHAEYVLAGGSGNPGSERGAGGEGAESGKGGVVHIFVDGTTPGVWKDIYAAQGAGEYLLAHLQWGGTRSGSSPEAADRPVSVGFDPVRFVKLNSVTNDGIVKYAKTAVELAIGLIGIMALWLGIMKIAEQSGLVSKLAALLRPLTTRLFPDVPPDHPAMGAMIMNISANMLGLANAATPLGLKAMEELNKLNKKAGTATDAMCTFLVINTSNVQLIPATVIAIRAAAGSANPTEILGPVIVATAVALAAGVTTVRLLAKLPVYRKQLEGGAD